MDYISREDALKIAWDEYDDGTPGDIPYRLERLPAADVIERKRGEWIHDYHYGLALPEHKCSICGEWEYSDEESNYCPNCGAKMEG